MRCDAHGYSLRAHWGLATTDDLAKYFDVVREDGTVSTVALAPLIFANVHSYRATAAVEVGPRTLGDLDRERGEWIVTA